MYMDAKSVGWGEGGVGGERKRRSAAETIRERREGVIFFFFFTNSPRREGKKGGKWWGVNFRQTLRALFVLFFFPNPLKKPRVCLSFWPDNNICKQLPAYRMKKKEREREREREGEKKHNAITPLPIKTELNKSSSSNLSHMSTCVARHPEPKTFLSCFALISSQKSFHV